MERKTGYVKCQISQMEKNGVNVRKFTKTTISTKIKVLFFHIYFLFLASQIILLRDQKAKTVKHILFVIFGLTRVQCRNSITECYHILFLTFIRYAKRATTTASMNVCLALVTLPPVILQH